MSNPSPAPAATVSIAGTSREVRFDLDRLIAIEETTGLATMQLVREFVSYWPQAEDGVKPSQKQIQAALAKFSVTLVSKFVAGCIGIPAAEAGKQIPVADLRVAFNALFLAFVEAVKQLNGTADAADPTPAQAASAA